MPDVELRDVTNCVCQNVNLAIRDRELMVLFGPSGAGKTTLLNVIAGLVDYEGTVLIDGNIVDGLDPSRRQIGYLFQSLFLFPHLNVKENIAYGLKMRGDSKEECRVRVETLLCLMKIEHLAGRYPKHLSGGEKQRVALARALAPSPRILLLDEPFNNLDSIISDHLQKQLKWIHQEIGITTLYVTHSLREASYLGDRMALVRNGRIEKVGLSEEIVAGEKKKMHGLSCRELFTTKENKMNGILNQVREQFVHLVDSHELRSEKIEIEARPLSPEEAIGITSRKDYPLMTGKERLIEARYKGAIGHAFTDSPGDMTSSIGELLALDISDNRSRAFFIASVNAVYRCLFPDIKTVHCRDEDPEVCGRTIAKELKRRFGQVSILLVGLNPAILDNLVAEFGQESVCAVDLSPNTIGKKKSGITIRDGNQALQESIEKSDVLLVTGTTLGNGTLDDIVHLAGAHEKTVLFYGVTISAAASLTGLERICPCAR